MTEAIKKTLKNARLHDATLDCVDKNGDVLLIRYRPVHPDESKTLRITGVKTMEALLDRGEILFDVEWHSVVQNQAPSTRNASPIDFYAVEGDWILIFSCSTRGFLKLLVADCQISVE